MKKKTIIFIVSLFCFLPIMNAEELFDILPINKNISIKEVEERYRWYKFVESDEYYQEEPGENCKKEESDFSDWDLIKPESKEGRVIEEKSELIDLSSREYNRIILDGFIIEYLDFKEIVLTNSLGLKIPFIFGECNNCLIKSNGETILNKNSSIELKLDKLYSDTIQVELRFGNSNNILFWETTLYKDSYPVRHIGVRTVGSLSRVCATTHCSYKLNYMLSWTEYSSYNNTYYRYKDSKYRCTHYKKEYVDGYYPSLEGYIKDENTKINYYKYEEVLPIFKTVFKFSECPIKNQVIKENKNDLIAVNYGSKKDSKDYSKTKFFILGILVILSSLVVICIKMRKNILNE